MDFLFPAFKSFVAKFESATPQLDFGNFTVGLATIIVATITFFVAVRSGRANSRAKIADLRAQWLEDLRAAIAHHTKLTYDLTYKWGREPKNSGTRSEEIDALLAQVMQNETNIRLLLNPTEFEHQAIVESLVQLRWLIIKTGRERSKFPFKEMQELRATLVNTSTVVIKSEWARLKYEVMGWSRFRIYLHRQYRRLWTKRDVKEWPDVPNPFIEKGTA